MVRYGTKYPITSCYEKTWNPIYNLKVHSHVIISRMALVCNSNTIILPSNSRNIPFFSFWKHPTCSIEIQSFEPNLIFNVTNVDSLSKEINTRQMEEVLQIVKSQREIGRDVILIGNLYRSSGDSIMGDFREELGQEGMQAIQNSIPIGRVSLEEQLGNYWLVPSDWEMVFFQILENYDDISAHRPVVAQLTKRFGK